MSKNPRLEPGYFQGETHGQLAGGVVGGARLGGRKSGREAPRDHVRQPARERILMEHGVLPRQAHTSHVLNDQPFDRNQGQLFDPQAVAPISVGDRSRSADFHEARGAGGVTGRVTAANYKKELGLGGQPGFMPDVAPKQKVAAVKKLGQIMGSDTPVRDVMRNRAAVQKNIRPGDADWYAPEGTDGRADLSKQGKATQVVQSRADELGVPLPHMTRATAIMSPQMPWVTDEGSMLHKSGVEPGTPVNADVAKNVVSSTLSHLSAHPDASDADVIEAGHRGLQTEKAKGGMPEMASKAALDTASMARGAEHGNYGIQNRTSLKAANFDASFHVTDENPAVRRVASEAYTVDRHDVELATKVPNKTSGNHPAIEGVGGYDLIAMTGARSALQRGTLPPVEQSGQWEAHRRGKGLSGGDNNSLFQTGTTTIRPELHPDHDGSSSNAAPAKSRSLQRGKRDIASDLGLDF